MFAIVRTGGKQYRVAAGDKIAVEKLAGDAGDTVVLNDVLMAGDGGDMKDAAKVKVAAEIIAQAKSEKVVVFKKKRRHNYRRKQGHRQQMTLLRITDVGGTKAPKKAEAKTADEPKADDKPASKQADAKKAPATKKAPAKKAKSDDAAKAADKE